MCYVKANVKWKERYKKQCPQNVHTYVCIYYMHVCTSMLNRTQLTRFIFLLNYRYCCTVFNNYKSSKQTQWIQYEMWDIHHEQRDGSKIKKKTKWKTLMTTKMLQQRNLKNWFFVVKPEQITWAETLPHALSTFFFSFFYLIFVNKKGNFRPANNAHKLH